RYCRIAGLLRYDRSAAALNPGFDLFPLFRRELDVGGGHVFFQMGDVGCSRNRQHYRGFLTRNLLGTQESRNGAASSRRLGKLTASPTVPFAAFMLENLGCCFASVPPERYCADEQDH